MRDEQTLLQDMLDAITSIESYTVSSYEAFLEDEKTQDAIMFNLIVVGEAANRISEEFQEKHPEIPWSSIIGTRNVIVHGYDQVKLLIVWDIIQKNLQPLKITLIGLIQKF
jgi:uncharacterized protein with HEPN domain